MPLSASTASAVREEKVRRIFERFDVNRDGGLDRDEMAALVVNVNPRVKFSEEQIHTILDELYRVYAEFILPGGRGLSLPGLLRSYDDGAGDVDRDFLALSLPAVEPSSPEIASEGVLASPTSWSLLGDLEVLFKRLRQTVAKQFGGHGAPHVRRGKLWMQTKRALCSTKQGKGSIDAGAGNSNLEPFSKAGDRWGTKYDGQISRQAARAPVS